MRRIIFYLSVALLAFGIGSFVVFNLYFKHAEQSVIAHTTEINRLENKEHVSTSIQETSQDEEPNDEEKAAFDVLKPTIKKWLRGEKIKKGWNDITSELIKEVTGKNENELSEPEVLKNPAFLPTNELLPPPVLSPPASLPIKVFAWLNEFAAAPLLNPINVLFEPTKA